MDETTILLWIGGLSIMIGLILWYLIKYHRLLKPAFRLSVPNDWDVDSLSLEHKLKLISQLVGNADVAIHVHRSGRYYIDAVGKAPDDQDKADYVN